MLRCLLFLAILLPLAAWSNANNITIGISPDFPPFEFIERGSLVGFDVDVANEIALRLNKKAAFHQTSFASLINLTATGRLDMAISAINPTAERKQNRNISFSAPYLRSGFAFISKRLMKNLEELKGGVVAVQMGSAMEVFLQNLRQNGLDIRIIALPTNNLAIEMLRNNTANFVCAEQIQAKQYIELDKSLRIFTTIEGGDYAIALPSGSALLPEINAIIGAMEEDGALERLKQKWFADTQNNPGRRNAARYIIGGVWITLSYSLAAIGCGLAMGTILGLCLCASSKIPRILAGLYVSIIRGTPLLLQLSVVYFLLPTTAWVAGTAALSLNSAAYIANIVRVGIKTIDKGQFEAADSLNLSAAQKYRDVIGPQVIVAVMPALINEVLNLVKESAVVSVVGGNEIMHRANAMGAASYSFFTPLLVAGLCYYLLSIIFSAIIFLAQRKYQQQCQ